MGACIVSDTRELHADEIFGRQATRTFEQHDAEIELSFTKAASLDNPLAQPLIQALRACQSLIRQRDDARVDLRAERVVREQAVHELARVTSENAALKRTIAALREAGR